MRYRKKCNESSSSEEVRESDELPANLLAVCEPREPDDTYHAGSVERNRQELRDGGRVSQAFDNRWNREAEAVDWNRVAPPDDHP